MSNFLSGGVNRNLWQRYAFLVAQPLSASKAQSSVAVSYGRSVFRAACLRARARMSTSEDSSAKFALAGGGILLTAALLNRLFLTPVDAMYPPQARSDILAVIASATLILLGLGRMELAERPAQVEMGGVEVRDEFNDVQSGILRKEIQWTAEALLGALPTVKSLAVVLQDGSTCRIGRFRDADAVPVIPLGGIAATALETGKRAYLADMKVVPVKEVEFGFLPENCQSVVVEPIGSSGVMILAADRARPLTGKDFGWLQAVADRLAVVVQSVRTFAD